MTTIKTIRKLLKLSQAALGEGIGCSQANVWQLECNGQELRPELASRLIDFAQSRGLAITLDQIYGRAALPEADEPEADETPARKVA